MAQLKFAFISCQDWSVNHWAGFDELLTQDLDFIVHLGDYIYETVKAGFQTGAVEKRARAAQPARRHQARRWRHLRHHAG